MTTIKECRIIEIYEKQGTVYIKKASPFITLYQADLCKKKYDELKSADNSIIGIVFLVEMNSIKDLTIIR